LLANFVTVSGTTVTGTTASFTSGVFTSLSGTTHTITSGVFASGTAALPSISFVSDPNTGIYSPDADQLAVATNGVERVEFGTAEVVFNDGGENYDFRVEGDTNTNLLFVDASFDTINFGVSGINSNFRLNVKTGSGNGAMVVVPDTDGTVPLVRALNAASSISVAEIGTVSGTALYFKTADTERLRLTSTGTLNFKGAGTAGSTQAVSFDGSAPVNSMVLDSSGLLGIGTSSPIAQLNNTGTTALGTVNWPTTDVGVAAGRVLIGNEGILVLRRETVGADSGAELYLGATSGAGSTTIGNVSLKGGTENASNRASFFSISTQNTVGTGAEAMRITSGGLVGIGNTGPSVALEIGAATGAAQVDANVLRVNRSVTGQYATFSSASGAATINGVNGSGGAIVFQGDGNPRAQIDGSGRLLVGTTTNSGAPSSGATIQLADQFSVRAVSGGGVTNQYASTASATTLNCVIDVPIGGNIYSSFIGSLYICQQLTNSDKSFLAEYRVKIHNSGGTTVFTLVDSLDDSSPNNVALTFTYSSANRQITVTSTWTTATSSGLNCNLIGAGAVT
jgi:hypothetical protein